MIREAGLQPGWHHPSETAVPRQDFDPVELRYDVRMRKWAKLPRSAKIKTVGYGISVLSVILLGVVSWKNAATDPLLAISLFGGATTSMLGMGLRWWSYELEETEKMSGD